MRHFFRLVTVYPVTTLCIVVIWVLCFCTPPKTPLENVPLMDKWTHILMYAGTCSVMWVEHLRCRKHTACPGQLFPWAMLSMIFMGGAIELLQAYCTAGRRSGDWFDFIANTIGVLLGFLFGYIVYRAKYRE